MLDSLAARRMVATEKRHQGQNGYLSRKARLDGDGGMKHETEAGGRRRRERRERESEGESEREAGKRGKHESAL
jgi:hypothetical protein